MIAARGNGPHLRDPNWYRVRYALAVQFIEIATMSHEGGTGSPSTPHRESRFRLRRGSAERPWMRRGVAEESSEPGWPREIHAEDGEWRKEFGEVTADTLSELYRNRAPGREHFDRAARSARQAAEELVASAAGMLEEAGWHWVGRKPPRFVRWKRAVSPARITRRRPVLDRELVRFLSWVVEPASVVLLFSAWLAEGEDGRFPLERLKEAIRGRQEPESFHPLDRRRREAEGMDWTIAYLARLVYDSRQATRSARAQARLGRTQLRRPREPSFRVQYNLACLFSRLMQLAAERGDRGGEREFASIAAGQLERALFRLPDEQRDRLAKWAEDDPGLEALRTGREGEFAEIIARWGAGDKQEWRLDDPVLVQRVKYDPGSAILDVYLLDGTKSQYAGVPVKVIDALFVSHSDDDGGDIRETRQKVEEAFLETVERDYPQLRS